MIPTLHTDRLTLRAPEAADFPAFAAFHASPRAAAAGLALDATRAYERLLALAGGWSLWGYGGWIVTLDGRPAGHVGLLNLPHRADVELAWALFDSFEGQGIAQEAARAARRFAVDTLGLKRLVSYVANGNARAAALARRLGCTPEAAPAHDPEATTWLHPREAA